MRKLVKRIGKNETIRAFVCWLIAQYIRIVHFSTRWETIGGEIPEAYWREGKPFVLAFWHGRIMMMPFCWPKGRPINMLTSSHRDGKLIGRTVAYFGIKIAEGSTTRGGGPALRVMLKAMKAGEWVGITPDGPRGPRMRASEGVAALARLSGLPVIPVCYSTTRGVNVDSWDRFLVAMPFARGIFIWGRPIHVAADADNLQVEAARREIEERLIALTDDADRRCGRIPIEPAPVPAPGNMAESAS